MWYGEHNIDEYLTFAVNTSQFSTGAGFDAAAVPQYGIYEDETAAEVVGPAAMAKLDDAGSVGFYTERVQLTDANFDAGKMYTIYITATVDGVAATTYHAFKMRPATNFADTALTDYDPPTNSELEARSQANSGEHMVNWLEFWTDTDYGGWYDTTDNEVKTDVQEVLDATPWDSSADGVLIAANAITAATTSADYLAEINIEVDTALNTAIPGGPTNNSINQRVLAIDDLTQAGGNGDLAAIDGKIDTIDAALGSLNDFNPDSDPVAVVTLVNGLAANTITTASINDGAITDAKIATVGVNLIQVNGNTTPINNWEDTYDGTGYADDVAPATQIQLTGIGGGVSIATIATGSIVAEGDETLTYAATATHDDSYYEVASDTTPVASEDIDFYLTFNTGAGMNFPIFFHLHGYYEDNNAAPNNTLNVQSWNFNISAWETIVVLSDSASDQDFDLPLHVHDVDPDGGGEGDVRIRFKLVATEVSQNMRIDHATVNYVSGAVSAAEVADAVWDEVIVSAHDTSNTAGALLDSPGDWATATGFAVASDVTTAHSTTDTLITNRSLAAADYFLFGSDPVAVVTLVNGLNTDVVSEAAVADAAWQELIELMFTFDATAVYGGQAGSVVDQIADNAAAGAGDATAGNQTTMLARLAAIMSKAAADPGIGTYNVATDSLEAQQENPQAPPIID